MAIISPEEYAALHEEADTGGGVPLNATSVGYQASRIVKAGAGRLYGLVAYSSNVAAQYILVFDSATVPANGTIPVIPVPVAAASLGTLYYGSVGRWFHRGIVVCTSTTPTTLTLGAADTFFDVQFI